MCRYDWSPGVLGDGILEASLAQDSEYVPMIWGEGDLTDGRLMNLDRVGDKSRYLMGFNEPNYGTQVLQLSNRRLRLIEKRACKDGRHRNA